jgi:hypothetical protein
VKGYPVRAAGQPAAEYRRQRAAVSGDETDMQPGSGRKAQADGTLLARGEDIGQEHGMDIRVVQRFPLN